MSRPCLRERLWLWGMPVNALQRTEAFGGLGFADSSLDTEQAMARTGVTNVLLAGGLPLTAATLASMPSARRILAKDSLHRGVPDGGNRLDPDAATGSRELWLSSGALALTAPDSFEVMDGAESPQLVAIAPSSIDQGESGEPGSPTPGPAGDALAIDLCDGTVAGRAAADLGHDQASHGDSGRGGHGHDHGGGAVDLPILIGGIGGFVLAGLVAIVRAYRSGRSFSGGLVLWCVPIFTVALIFVAVFGPDCEVGDAPVTFDPLLLHGIVLSFFATTIFAAFAVCSSVWVGKGATFCATAALFLLGLWRGGSSNVAETAAWTETYPADAGGGLWSFVPDFQIFWVGDLAYTPEVVPDAVFVTRAGLYAVAFAVTFLAIGALSLRHRSL